MPSPMCSFKGITTLGVNCEILTRPRPLQGCGKFSMKMQLSGWDTILRQPVLPKVS